MTSTSMILNNFGTYNWHTNVLKLSQTNFGISWHNMFYIFVKPHNKQLIFYIKYYYHNNVTCYI